MTVLGICRRPRASAGWVRGPSTKPSSTRSAYLVPSAEFATPGLGVLVIDDPECLKVKVKAISDFQIIAPDRWARGGRRRGNILKPKSIGFT